MSRVGILVASRKPRSERVPLPDGTTHGVPAQREKETDLRIGLDMVRIARNGALDVSVIFSQDQDLAELAQKVHTNRIDLQCQISTKTRSLLYPDIKPEPGGEQLQILFDFSRQYLGIAEARVGAGDFLQFSLAFLY